MESWVVWKAASPSRVPCPEGNSSGSEAGRGKSQPLGVSEEALVTPGDVAGAITERAFCFKKLGT